VPTSRRITYLKQLITKTFPLSQSKEAFEAVRAGNDIKVIVKNQEMCNGGGEARSRVARYAPNVDLLVGDCQSGEYVCLNVSKAHGQIWLSGVFVRVQRQVDRRGRIDR
jgi:hypothetical protein